MAAFSSEFSLYCPFLSRLSFFVICLWCISLFIVLFYLAFPFLLSACGVSVYLLSFSISPFLFCCLPVVYQFIYCPFLSRLSFFVVCLWCISLFIVLFYLAFPFLLSACGVSVYLLSFSISPFLFCCLPVVYQFIYCPFLSRLSFFVVCLWCISLFIVLFYLAFPFVLSACGVSVYLLSFSISPFLFCCLPVVYQFIYCPFLSRLSFFVVCLWCISLFIVLFYLAFPFLLSACGVSVYLLSFSISPFLFCCLPVVYQFIYCPFLSRLSFFVVCLWCISLFIVLFYLAFPFLLSACGVSVYLLSFSISPFLFCCLPVVYQFIYCPFLSRLSFFVVCLWCISLFIVLFYLAFPFLLSACGVSVYLLSFSIWPFLFCCLPVVYQFIYCPFLSGLSFFVVCLWCISLFIVLFYLAFPFLLSACGVSVYLLSFSISPFLFCCLPVVYQFIYCPFLSRLSFCVVCLWCISLFIVLFYLAFPFLLSACGVSVYLLSFSISPFLLCCLPVVYQFIYCPFLSGLSFFVVCLWCISLFIVLFYLAFPFLLSACGVSVYLLSFSISPFLFCCLPVVYQFIYCPFLSGLSFFCCLPVVYQFSYCK